MPLVDITLTAGRSERQVRDLIHALHDAVRRTTGARDEHIRVIVREVPRSRWATGDVTVDEMRLPTASPDPALPPTSTPEPTSEESS